MQNYGITVEQYDEMLAKQGGCCAICGDLPGSTKRKFHVDHDHQTGRVRGILCMRCNLVLGYAKETPAVLSAAILYLENS